MSDVQKTTNREIDFTASDIELACRILSRLGMSTEACPWKVDWVAEEICKHRERSNA